MPNQKKESVSDYLEDVAMRRYDHQDAKPILLDILSLQEECFNTDLLKQLNALCEKAYKYRISVYKPDLELLDESLKNWVLSKVDSKYIGYLRADTNDRTVAFCEYDFAHECLITNDRNLERAWLEHGYNRSLKYENEKNYPSNDWCASAVLTFRTENGKFCIDTAFRRTVFKEWLSANHLKASKVEDFQAKYNEFPLNEDAWQKYRKKQQFDRSAFGGAVNAGIDVVKIIIGTPIDAALWIGGFFAGFLAGEYSWNIFAWILARSDMHKDLLTCAGPLLGLLVLEVAAMISYYCAKRGFIGSLIDGLFGDDNGGTLLAAGFLMSTWHAAVATFYNVPAGIRALMNGKIMLFVSHALYEVLAIVLIMVAYYCFGKAMDAAYDKNHYYQ